MRQPGSRVRHFCLCILRLPSGGDSATVRAELRAGDDKRANPTTGKPETREEARAVQAPRAPVRKQTARVMQGTCKEPAICRCDKG
jgi:hypothetical protein